MKSVILFILFCTTLILLRHGWRGRRLDDHPWCVSCRFDLHGRWPDITACPECGAALAARRAVRHGRRSRRPVVLTLGVLLASLLVGVIGVAVWTHLASVDIVRIKPAWLLVQEVRLPGADDAIEELRRRANTSGLLDRHLESVARHGLQRQTRTDVEWNHALGDLVILARASQLVDDADWHAFLERGVSLDMTTRERAWAGDTPWIKAVLANDALGDEQRLRIQCGAVRVHTPESEKNVGGGYVISDLGREAIVHTGLSWPLAPGDDAATVDFELSIDGWTWIASERLEMQGVPASETLIRSVTRPEFEACVRDAVSITQVELREDQAGHHTLNCVVTVQQRNLPMAVCFDVAARIVGDADADQDAEPLSLGSGCFWSPSFDAAARHFMKPVDDFEAEAVDIILNAEPAAAMRTVDVDEIWDGSIVFEDLPVERITR